MRLDGWHMIELPEPPAPKVLAWRYLFATSYAETFGPTPLYPILVVATEGAANDWAAYIAGVGIHVPAPDERDDQYLAHVARWGHKLTEGVALGFFPGLAAGRTYRE